MEEMVKKRNQRVLLLMAEILHQLRLVVYPTIYRGLYIPGGAGFQASTVPNCPFLGKQNLANNWRITLLHRSRHSSMFDHLSH